MSEAHPFPTQAIAAEYGLTVRPESLRYLGGAGGFSGAEFWRFDTVGRRSLCLRLWPARTSAARVAEVHRIIFRAAEAGLDFLAVPLHVRSGVSQCLVGERIAEVVPWLEGSADFCVRPSDERLVAAMVALARFHEAIAPSPSDREDRGPCPGIVARRRRVADLSGGLLRQLEEAVARNRTERLADLSQSIVQQARDLIFQLQPRLNEAAGFAIRTQPCLRDIRHEHVLFVGDRVSGIVDYDAMRVDNVALDVARLVQSLMGNDDESWSAAISAYQCERALDEYERRLLPLLRDANPILSALSWVQWLFLDGRKFDDMQDVEQRMAALVALS